eukprot:10781453-Lingulodinium_polyedra.AAC.1
MQPLRNTAWPRKNGGDLRKCSLTRHPSVPQRAGRNAPTPSALGLGKSPDNRNEDRQTPCAPQLAG